MQVDVPKSTITDQYTVQTELGEKINETVLKMQEYYRNWAAPENNSVLENLLFKLKHDLQCFQDNFCHLGRSSAFEKFKKTLIDEMKHYAPDKKLKALRHTKWIDNSIKNLATKNKKFYQR